MTLCMTCGRKTCALRDNYDNCLVGCIDYYEGEPVPQFRTFYNCKSSNNGRCYCRKPRPMGVDCDKCEHFRPRNTENAHLDNLKEAADAD